MFRTKFISLSIFAESFSTIILYSFERNPITNLINFIHCESRYTFIHTLHVKRKKQPITKEWIGFFEQCWLEFNVPLHFTKANNYQTFESEYLSFPWKIGILTTTTKLFPWWLFHSNVCTLRCWAKLWREGILGYVYVTSM